MSEALQNKPWKSDFDKSIKCSSYRSYTKLTRLFRNIIDRWTDSTCEYLEDLDQTKLKEKGLEHERLRIDIASLYLKAPFHRLCQDSTGTRLGA